MPYPPNNFALDEDSRRSIEAARVGGMGASSEFVQAPLAGPQYDYKLGERSFGYSPGQRTPTQLGSPLDVSQGLFRGVTGGVGRGLKSLVHAGQYLGNLAGSAGEFIGLPQNLNPEGNRPPESYGAYRLGQWIEDQAPRAFPPATPQAPGEPPTFASRVGEAGGFMANMAVGGALGGPPGLMAAAAGETMAPSYETAKYLGADDQTATNRAAASGVFNAGLMGIGGPTQVLGRIFKEPARQIAEVGFAEAMRRVGAEGVKGTINMGAIAGATTLGEQAIQQQPFDLGQAGMAALEAAPIGTVLGAGGAAARDIRLPSLQSVSGAIKRSGEAAEGRIKASNASPRMNIDPKLMGDYAKVGASIVAEGLENLGDFLKRKKAELGDKVSDEDLSRVHNFALLAYRQEQSKLPILTSRTETTERVAGQVEAQNPPPEIANEVQAKGQGQAAQGQEGLLTAVTKPGGDSTTPPATTAKEVLYHGTRLSSLNSFLDKEGNLVLKPSENFGGRQVGVSFGESRGVAEDYRTRVPGTPIRSQAQGMIFEVDKDAIPMERLKPQSQGEIQAMGDQPIVIPKGKFRVLDIESQTKAKSELSAWEDKIRAENAPRSDADLAMRYVKSIEAAEIAEHNRTAEDPEARHAVGVSQDIVAKYGEDYPEAFAIREEIAKRIAASGNPEAKARELAGHVGDSHFFSESDLAKAFLEIPRPKPTRAKRIGETIPPPPKGNLPFTNALKAGEVSEGVDLPKLGPGKGEQLPLDIPSGQKGQKVQWEAPPDEVVDIQNKNRGKGILETLPSKTSESQLPVGGTDIAGQVMNAARAEQGPARSVLYTVGKRLRNAVAVDKTVAGSVAQRVKNFTRTYRGDKQTIAEMAEPVQLKSITGQDVPNGYWTKKTDAIEGRAEKTVGGLVGTADYPGLSPKARAATLEFRRIYTDAIERGRALGARWMKDPATGTWFDVGNQVKTEGKVPRWRTEAERDIWFDKYDEDHKVLLEVVSKANNITVEDAQAKFDQIGASSGDRTVGAVEVMRAFKIFPEAIKSAKTGELIWLIEPDPIKHVTSGIEKVARAAGFQSQFPKETFSELKDAALSSAKDRKNAEKVLDRANRAAQGAPLESDEWAGGLLNSIGKTVPGAKMVGKAIKASDTVLKGAALTGSAVQQVVEPMGSIPAYTGSANLAKGYAESLTSPTRTNESLHEIGAINNKALDTRITSLEDASRFVSTALTTVSGFTPVNQLNEAASGAAGQAFVRGIKENAKGGKPAEAATVDSLRRLKFTEGQIRNLVRGKASKILENDVVQRIVTYTQGENQRALERPVWGESKIIGSFQPFLRYANLASDAVVTGLQNVHNQMQRAQTMPNGPTRNAQVAASIKGLGRYLAGKQAAGAATVALASLYFGRTLNRDDENWAEYVGNNFLAGGVGAQTTSAYYRIRNASESGANPVVALGVGGNPTMNAFANFAKAWGRIREYRDTNLPEAAFKLLQQTVPGARISAGVMALAGMGESPDLNKAIRRVNEIRKDLGFMEGGLDFGYDPFRHDMKALIKALKSGDEDEALSLYANIVKNYNQPPPGAPASERIDASVRGRLALAGKGGAPLSPQEREMFKQKLGEKDYSLLEAYDKTLLAITSENLGVAGEFYYKLGELRGAYKASGKPEKTEDLQVAEALSGKIHRLQAVIDATADKAEIQKYQAYKYDLFKYATEYLNLPKTGTERANLKRKIDEILKEKK